MQYFLCSGVAEIWQASLQYWTRSQPVHIYILVLSFLCWQFLHDPSFGFVDFIWVYNSSRHLHGIWLTKNLTNECWQPLRMSIFFNIFLASRWSKLPRGTGKEGAYESIIIKAVAHPWAIAAFFIPHPRSAFTPLLINVFFAMSR